MVPVIHSATIDAIKSFDQNFSDESFHKVNGILQMNNINDDRKAHTKDLALGEFDLEDIQEIFERVAEYGEISIFDVAFSFWINPLSLKVGSGKSKSKARGIHPKTLHTPTYKDMNVGCAASSIVFSLAKSGYYGSIFANHISDNQGQKRWFEEAKSLRAQLGWDNEVSFSELGNFVNHYPTHRIIVADLTLPSSKCSDWKGEENNIVFLHFDSKDRHISAISSIHEFIQRKG